MPRGIRADSLAAVPRLPNSASWSSRVLNASRFPLLGNRSKLGSTPRHFLMPVSNRLVSVDMESNPGAPAPVNLIGYGLSLLTSARCGLTAYSIGHSRSNLPRIPPPARSATPTCLPSACCWTCSIPRRNTGCWFLRTGAWFSYSMAAGDSPNLSTGHGRLDAAAVEQRPGNHAAD